MLAVDGVTFSYSHGSPPVLNGLTHTFAEGSVTAVTGTSGGGKSTLLYVLGLMLTPQSGSVMVDGVTTTALSDGERSRLRASRIGFVFQDAVLDPSRTVLDNVAEGALFAHVPRRVAERRAAALLEELGVNHRYDHKPGEISGGQAQRVALCRALVKEPTIVLADEPSGNLDPQSADVVWGVLHDRASAGVTVVVATHDPQRAPSASERVHL